MQFKLTNALAIAILVASPVMANPLARRGNNNRNGTQVAQNNKLAAVNPVALAAVVPSSSTSAAAASGTVAVPPAATTDATLLAANIQLGSASNGQAVTEAGQVPSDTYVLLDRRLLRSS